METKVLSRVQVKSADQGLVSAVFSTFNTLDHDGDVVLPGALKSGSQVRISAYGHTSWGGMLPVGKGTIRTTPTEAILDGKFFLSTTAGRETFEVVKELGPLQEWSYSLSNIKARRGRWEGREARIIESVDVHEVSPVLKGASIGTRTISTKQCAGCTRHQGHPDFTRDEMLAIREKLFAERRQQLEREYLKFLSLQCAGATQSPGILDGVEQFDASAVPEGIRRIAGATVKMAADHLGVATPAVRWFATRGDLQGYVLTHEAGVVNLKAGLSLSETIRIAGHEVAHLAGLDEEGARRYERTFQQEVLGA